MDAIHERNPECHRDSRAHLAAQWLILIVGIVVAAGTYLYYKHKPLTFQSKPSST